MTSQKIRSAPWARLTSRRPSRKPGRGGTTPMLPATGSTITAAISPPRAWKSARTAARSLNGAVSVRAAGWPGEEASNLAERGRPGRAARDAEGAHRGLGAGAHEPHQLDGRVRGG